MSKKEITILSADVQSGIEAGCRALNLSIGKIEWEFLPNPPQGFVRLHIYEKNIDDTMTRDIDDMLDRIDIQIVGMDTQLVTKEKSDPGDFLDSILDDKQKEYYDELPIQFEEIEIIRVASVNTSENNLLEDVNDSQLIQQRTLIAYAKKQEDAKEALCADSRVELVQENEIWAMYSETTGWLFFDGKQLRVVPYDSDAYMEWGDISAQSATCHLFPQRGKGKLLTVNDVMKQMTDKGITHGVDKQAIENAVNEIKNGSVEPCSLVAARWTAPIPGIDATIEKKFDSDEGKVTGFEILPDGKVNYRAKANVPSVEKDTVIAVLIPAKKGQNGMDIYGKVVETSEPENSPVANGDNVDYNSQTMEYKSTINGMACLHENVLSVYPAYVVKGDVDYHTGNIEFHGNLMIYGSVMPGFSVVAKGDIHIYGDLEAAVVKAGRHLLVKGGIINTLSDAVIVGGDLYASYLQKASVECLGNVTIYQSCMHSKIDCMGSLDLVSGKGTFVGGSLSCFRGADIKELGSSIGTPTKCLIAEDFLCRKRIEEAEYKRGMLKESLNRLEAYLLPLLKKIGPGFILQPEQQNRLRLILDKRNEVKNELDHNEKRLRYLKALVPEAEDSSLVVRGHFYPDVIFKMGGKPIVRDEVEMGIEYHYNSETKEITRKNWKL